MLRFYPIIKTLYGTETNRTEDHEYEKLNALINECFKKYKNR